MRAPRLRAAGYALPDTEVSFRDIAKLNQVTPNKLYEAASITAPRGQGNSGQHSGGGGGGRGYGRMTLGDLCAQESIALDQAIARLTGLGVHATEDQSLRDLADQLGMDPYEVLPVLKGEVGPTDRS